MVVYEILSSVRIFRLKSETYVLMDNHSKISNGPIRIESTSVRVIKDLYHMEDFVRM